MKTAGHRHVAARPHQPGQREGGEEDPEEPASPDLRIPGMDHGEGSPEEDRGEGETGRGGQVALRGAAEAELLARRLEHEHDRERGQHLGPLHRTKAVDTERAREQRRHDGRAGAETAEQDAAAPLGEPGAVAAKECRRLHRHRPAGARVEQHHRDGDRERGRHYRHREPRRTGRFSCETEPVRAVDPHPRDVARDDRQEEDEEHERQRAGAQHHAGENVGQADLH